MCKIFSFQCNWIRIHNLYHKCGYYSKWGGKNELIHISQRKFNYIWQNLRLYFFMVSLSFEDQRACSMFTFSSKLLKSLLFLLLNICSQRSFNKKKLNFPPKLLILTWWKIIIKVYKHEKLRSLAVAVLEMWIWRMTFSWKKGTNMTATL
jgi:hypothetical protein